MIGFRPEQVEEVITANLDLKHYVFCSTTAVYGLLSKNGKAITEDIPARAVEPYGKSKLEGEKIVQEISSAKRIESIIIIPVAVFGPGEHTPFGG